MTTEPTACPSGDRTLDLLAEELETQANNWEKTLVEIGEPGHPDFAAALVKVRRDAAFLRSTAALVAAQQDKIRRLSALLVQLDRAGGLGSHRHEQIRATVDGGPSAGYLAVHAAAQAIVAEIPRYRREFGDRLADILLLLARQVTG